MRFSLKPLRLVSAINLQCPECKKVLLTGDTLILLVQEGRIAGCLKDTQYECCKTEVQGPMVFRNMEEAEFFVRVLRSQGPDQDPPLIFPAKPYLEDLLKLTGRTLKEAQALVTIQIQAGPSSRN